ncbi:polysaccharide biosynthesis/export family protein [Algirhabdus cladophorae]|uniref:polysaccharide biosynthesis/export family protein n=1 Tax=Algirhabdus cladophorae TaxID=3377108 RepID=UPI003B847FB4
MERYRKIGLFLAVLLSVAGCTLPRGAALETEILAGADDPSADFAIYPVSKAFLPSVSQWPSTGGILPHNWIHNSGASRGTVIAAGDTLNLAIWDANDNSLLTGQGQRVVTMDNMRVSGNGTIFVPYIDAVRVAGLTPDGARRRVQSALEGTVPSAQVQLSLVEQGRQSSVDLVGGVGSPGSYPLLDRGYTVLSLLSVGGGVKDGINNPQLKLYRGGSTYQIGVDRLYASPSHDAVLRAGDKVVIDADRRYFLSLGATGSEAIIPFNRSRMTALDALAEIGGVDDARANLQGILVLREYPSSALRAGVRGPRQQRVVFTLDLTTADGLFSAKNFLIHHEDVVLGTESPVTAANTVASLVGKLFGLASTVAN